MASDNIEINVGQLENEALKRKERLNALKRGELKTLDASNSNKKEEEDLLFPKPIFRNYTPKDESLKPGVLPKPNLIEIEDQVKDQLDSGKPLPLIEKEIDLATLAPQKIDWDLKRDAEKKLKILEKRTQRAIVDLIRIRLKQQKNTDLAELVSIGSRGNVKDEKNTKGEDSEEDDEEEEENDENEEMNAQTFQDNQKSNNSNSSDKNDSDNETKEDLQFFNNKQEISDDDDY